MWVPIHQTNLIRKDKQENYFIVGFNDTEINCIICKGETFPQTLPRPILTSLGLKVPLMKLDTQAAQYEEEFDLILFFSFFDFISFLVLNKSFFF